MAVSNAWWVTGKNNPWGGTVAQRGKTPEASMPAAPWTKNNARPVSSAPWVNARTFDKKLEDCADAKKRILSGNGRETDAFRVISWDAKQLLAEIEKNGVPVSPDVKAILVQKAKKFASKVLSAEYTC